LLSLTNESLVNCQTKRDYWAHWSGAKTKSFKCASEHVFNCFSFKCHISVQRGRDYRNGSGIARGFLYFL